jgi:thiosulfate/3-mercaptopyruvate sulfurtransferase
MVSRHIRRRSHAPTMRGACLALMLIAAAAPASAQTSPRAQLLVTPTWLVEHVNDPDIVLLHVGDKAEYDAGHIPGARYISQRDVDGGGGPDGLPLELPKPDDLRQRLERFGISDDARVVVYYGNDWVSPATRILYTLDYAGLGDRTALLDGGMGAWKQAGGSTTTDVPAARTGSLSARPPNDIVVDAAWVQSNLGKPGIVIVDARDASFYDGVQAGHGDVRGHIAGAVSIPFTSVFDDELRLRPEAELREIFRSAGVDAGETVVLYCHIGQQATAVVFAARTLGFTPKLYDGSAHDWGARGLPFELPRNDERP